MGSSNAETPTATTQHVGKDVSSRLYVVLAVRGGMKMSCEKVRYIKKHERGTCWIKATITPLR
jgi:hypothetical protein